MMRAFFHCWWSWSLVNLLILQPIYKETCAQTTSTSLHHFRPSMSSDSAAAISFIRGFQEPNNATGHVYSVVEAGYGGGFASQFQVVATEWLKIAAGSNYSVPVLIRGHLKGYTDGKECSHVRQDWTCLFLPMSAHQEVLLQTGRRVAGVMKPAVDMTVIPKEFRHRGLAWWWGAVQAYMFRLQPTIERYVQEELLHMNTSFPPPGYAVAGLHVRHGDKASDGFKHQSFEAELRAVHKSPDCVKLQPVDTLSNDTTTMAISNTISKTDSTIDNTGGAAVVVPMCLTTSGGVNEAARLAENSAGDGKLTSLKMFVASDDAGVLGAAKKMGLLVDSSGVSQQTSTKGMFLAMISRPEIGYNASLEIVSHEQQQQHFYSLLLTSSSLMPFPVHPFINQITDIYFLSRCTTLVGIAASQVFRVAVGISNATGLLRAALVMDLDQTPRIKRMSEKFGLPFPELFINAKG